MFKRKSDFIEERTQEEIQTILNHKGLYDGEEEYRRLYHKLYNNYIYDRVRDWDYEYDQYNRLIARMYQQ